MRSYCGISALKNTILYHKISELYPSVYRLLVPLNCVSVSRVSCSLIFEFGFLRLFVTVLWLASMIYNEINLVDEEPVTGSSSLIVTVVGALFHYITSTVLHSPTSYLTSPLRECSGPFSSYCSYCNQHMDALAWCQLRHRRWQARLQYLVRI